MAPVDIMLSSSIIAATFLQALSILVHKKYGIYDVFIGKKYAFIVHAALISLAWLQVAGITVYAYFSQWRILSVPVVGMLVCCMSVFLFIRAIKEVGVGALWNKSLFGGRRVETGAAYRTFKHPMYLAFIGVYVGIALIFGRGGYYVAAGTLVPCLFLLSLVEKDKKQKLKHNV
jgi:protein-S-isoprenylcysteine O-methyltransferase Ste14